MALRSFFSLFGSIIDIKVVSVGKKGLSEGHILFDSPDAVDKVLVPENLGTLPCEVQPVLLLLRCLCTRCVSCARRENLDLMIMVKINDFRAHESA